MKRVFWNALLICFAVLLTACTPEERASTTATGTVGNIYLLREGPYEYQHRITGIDDKYVLMDVHSGTVKKGEVTFYRGLINLTSSWNDKTYEYRYNEEELESLFPLKVGTELITNGYLYKSDQALATKFDVIFQVLKKKYVKLDNQKVPVFLIKQFINYNDGKEPTVLFHYYSKEHGISLKRIHNRGKYSSKLSVTGVITGNAPRQKRRRTGTVAI